jgi:type VI secretion system protein ImpI
MGKGLRVQVTNAQDGSAFERTFDDFPIRIGRDALNELPIDLPFVSKFHAVIDHRGDKLILRDLGSRNGTSLRIPTERIPSNESIDLAKSDHLFGIGTLRFEVELIDVDRASSANLRRARGGAILSHGPDEESPPSFIDSLATSASGSHEAQAGADALRVDLESWRSAWAKLYARLSSVLASLPSDEREKALRALAHDHPSLAGEPDFLRLAEHLGVKLGAVASAGGSGSREESVALLVLRDLASWYVDAERPLQSGAQIVAFGRKIQDVLDALFVSFIPLRDGLKKFEVEFEVKVGVATQSARGPAETAKNPAQLASRLLDWSEQADSGRTVKRVFADLMVHNVGLVNGVMRGAAALLAQLAPATLEEELEADKSRGRSGLTVGPWKYRALWDVLKRRHDDLANEEQERFALLFGADFAHAYTALSSAARFSKTPEIEHARTKTPGTVPPTAPPAPREGPTGTLVVEESSVKGGRR